MFWIICGIISCVLLKWTLNRNEDGTLNIKDSTIGNFIVTGLLFGIAIIQFGIGINVYPSLSGDLAEIRSLENRIEDVRNSNYEYEKDGSFIAGSIENYQQSTILSKYVSDLAEKEASYSSELSKAKVHKRTFSLHFFSIGWAISDKVNELPVLEGTKP